jgi:hypothetical protein
MNWDEIRSTLENLINSCNTLEDFALVKSAIFGKAGIITTILKDYGTVMKGNF